MVGVFAGCTQGYPQSPAATAPVVQSSQQALPCPLLVSLPTCGSLTPSALCPLGTRFPPVPSASGRSLFPSPKPPPAQRGPQRSPEGARTGPSERRVAGKGPCHESRGNCCPAPGRTARLSVRKAGWTSVPHPPFTFLSPFFHIILYFSPPYRVYLYWYTFQSSPQMHPSLRRCSP